MSYCRFSDMNHTSDVYAYQDEIGFCIMLAQFRYNKTDNLPPMPKLGSPNFIKEYRQHDMALQKCKDEHGMVMINLPYAGETIHVGTLEAFKEKLLELREIGYKFPDWVLGQVDDELRMENQNG